MKPIGTSLLILNDADQILLLLRDDIPDIPYPNMWDIPGGHVEPNETPEQCIIREMKEEMGLDIPPPRLFLITEFPGPMMAISGMGAPGPASVLFIGVMISAITWTVSWFIDRNRTVRGSLSTLGASHDA